MQYFVSKAHKLSAKIFYQKGDRKIIFDRLFDTIMLDITRLKTQDIASLLLE
jgi:hypothetical protein